MEFKIYLNNSKENRKEGLETKSEGTKDKQQDGSLKYKFKVITCKWTRYTA